MSLIFDIASDRIAKEGQINWVTDTDIRMLLMRGAGVPIKANATVLAALAEASVDEIVTTGYSRKTMAGKAITTAGNKTVFDGDDVQFNALGNGTNDTITGALIYKGTLLAADDATNIPICYIRFDTALLTNGGTVTISKNAVNKWFYLDNTA